MITRRHILGAGGVVLAGLAAPPGAWAGGVVDIRMEGRPDGSSVWFNPVGVHVMPGQTVRWTNKDAGNAHTVTAYHPRNLGHQRRMPVHAVAWDSDYLLPDEMFSIVLTDEGVYDYFCIPHEHAGMVGRIVVGNPPVQGDPFAETADRALEPVPDVALRNFPPVREILAKGLVEMHGTTPHSVSMNPGGG